MWVSTDPWKQDVFIWNQAELPITIETLVNARPNITYHFLPASGVKLSDGEDFENGVQKTNRNTQFQTKAFPIVLAAKSLGGNCAPGTNPTVVLASAPEKDSKRGPNGKPTHFDTTQVPICAARFQFSLNAFWAQLVAHEIGHNFDLSHPGRSAPYDAASYPIYSLLPVDKYTRDPQAGTMYFYIWLEDYLYSIAGGGDLRHRAERPYVGIHDLSGEYQKITIQSPEAYRPPGLDRAIYAVTTAVPLPNLPVDQATSRIWVETSLFNSVPGTGGAPMQTVNLMNWSPRLELQYQNYGSWTFSDHDLAGLCLKESCQ